MKPHWIKGSRIIDSTKKDNLERDPYIPPEIQEKLIELNNSDSNIDTRRFDAFYKAITNVLPQNCTLQISGKSVYIRENGTKYPVSIIGSGHQSYMYLLFELLKNSRNIIAIEDPDIHMHPRMARELFRFIQKLNNQVFIATHSTIFLDINVLENNLIFSKEDDSTKIKRATKEQDLYKVLDMIGYKPSDALFPNKVLFVEGDTEKVLIPKLLEKININPNSPQFRVVNIGGNTNHNLIKNWAESVKGKDVNLYLIIDNEDGYKELEEKVMSYGIIKENIQVLNGTIEDLYPVEKVNKFLEDRLRVTWKKGSSTIKKVDVAKPRVEEIKRILKEMHNTNQRNEFWKVPLGSYMSDNLSIDEIEKLDRNFVVFLSKLSR